MRFLSITLLLLGLTACGTKPSSTPASGTLESGGTTTQNHNPNCAIEECDQWSTLTSGVTGKVTVPPGCGTIPADGIPNVCQPQPVAAAFKISRQDAASGSWVEVFKFESDTDGHYGVKLPPGKYEIRELVDSVKGEHSFFTFEPVEFDVTSGEILELDLSYHYLIPPL